MKRIALAPAFILAACATSDYNQPYGEVRVDTIRAADPNVIAVIINRVDGRTSLEIGRAVMPPGSHKLTLDVPPRKGFHTATQEEFVIDVAPCTRYYIAARLESPVLQEWKPFVRSTEPIGECMARFKVG